MERKKKKKRKEKNFDPNISFKLKISVRDDSKINFYDLPTNDPKRRKPDISLANKKLNWLPKITLKEGLINTFKHYKWKNW